MEKVNANVELDASTWDRIDAEGRRSGQSRDEVIDVAVRRALGGKALEAILARVRERSELTPEEADKIAADEKAAFRAGQSSEAVALRGEARKS